MLIAHQLYTVYVKPLSIARAPLRGRAPVVGTPIHLAIGLADTLERSLLFLGSATELWADMHILFARGLTVDCLVVRAMSRSSPLYGHVRLNTQHSLFAMRHCAR